MNDHKPGLKYLEKNDCLMMTGVDELGNSNGMKQRRKVSSEVATIHVITIVFYCALAMSIVWALTIAFR